MINVALPKLILTEQRQTGVQSGKPPEIRHFASADNGLVTIEAAHSSNLIGPTFQGLHFRWGPLIVLAFVVPRRSGSYAEGFMLW
ncbi:hypothetical protein SV7mr_05730 [Stieleria bergensis]|uniref:Uncharacterized protein n=1 Tax=Stieleria bergensis TaxID=2528025 RepID=A0A517SPN0_9BACT|nr:hypothetical protein SV7mr_05730 [Planctomycetes bacterium SV_7m_r]